MTSSRRRVRRGVFLMAELGNILLVIPARGGSKRLPKKNVLPLAGKPLICWTIEAALMTGLEARILVTSDDAEILGIVKEYEENGVIPYKRSAELATDTSSTADALLDVVEAERKAGYIPDTIVLLQPTSPLRNSDDIVEAVRLFEDTGCSDTIVSVCEVDHPTAWVGKIGAEAQFSGIDLSHGRSQDYHKEYRLNGAVYVAHARTFAEKGTFFTGSLRASVMPRIRSFDIDEEIDFKVCESLVGII